MYGSTERKELCRRWRLIRSKTGINVWIRFFVITNQIECDLVRTQQITEFFFQYMQIDNKGKGFSHMIYDRYLEKELEKERGRVDD